MTGPLRIGLAGVHGHGRSHVDAALALEHDAQVRVVAVADPRGSGDVPARTTWFPDAAEMIAASELDVVVLSTPIPTHAPLAIRALEGGAHVLLEKPPVATVADHERVSVAEAAAARAVQVGFQSLASGGIAAARDVAASGTIGEIVHYGAVGAWSRSEEYWRRAPWAGHRVLDGRVVADGVVTNPLAHAVATALAIAGAQAPGDVTSVETDLRRANDIATDDTSTVRVGLRGGAPLLAALAATASRRHEPFVLVRGTRGHVVYHYTLDILHVHRDGAPLPQTFSFSRRGLLADLCAHIRHGEPLAVPLSSTGAFTRVLEAVVRSADPVAIPASRFERRDRDGETFRVVPGIEDLVAQAAWHDRLFRELPAGDPLADR